MPCCHNRATNRQQMETTDNTQPFKRAATFYRIFKTIPGISKKVLTDNLRALEDDGLIEREVFAEVPPRVVYSLSELGKTLRPILDAMMDWGIDYKSKFF